MTPLLPVTMQTICQSVWLLGLWLGLGAAILAGSADHKNTDQLISQESHLHQRSTVYDSYYPDEGHGPDHGFSGYYPPPPPPAPHYPHHYSQHDPLKALLVPLAGLALISAVSVFASHPVLLQLGAVGRRRREAEGQESHHLAELALLDDLMAQLPPAEVAQQERRLLARLLSCSGGSVCVERLSCEIHKSRVQAFYTERKLMDMVISEITSNEFIDQELKRNILRARTFGIHGKDCSEFTCTELDKVTKVVKA